MSSANVEPQNPGFEGQIDTGDGTVTVNIDCYNTACQNGVTIGGMEVSGGKSAMVTCDGEKEWTEGIGRYAYRMCGFLNG